MPEPLDALLAKHDRLHAEFTADDAAALHAHHLIAHEMAEAGHPHGDEGPWTDAVVEVDRFLVQDMDEVDVDLPEPVLADLAKAIQPGGSDLVVYLTAHDHTVRIEPVTKHPGHPDQKVHGRRHGSSAGHVVTDAQAADILGKVQQNEGLSVHLPTNSEPTKGYMVAMREHSMIVPEKEFFEPTTGKAAIARYLKDKGQYLQGEQFLGLWHDKGHREVVLDVVDNIMDRDEAIALGRERNQQSIWDVVRGVEIPTGGTGDREAAAKSTQVDPSARPDAGNGRGDRRARRSDLGAGGRIRGAFARAFGRAAKSTDIDITAELTDEQIQALFDGFEDEDWAEVDRVIDAIEDGLDLESLDLPVGKAKGNADVLRRYWVSGAGAGKIGWGAGGDFTRCVEKMTKYMSPEDAKGYCNLRHKDANGFYPGDARNRTTKAIDAVEVDDQRRFTLGPWYVPNRYDAHDEWTDPDTLQKAAWEYVKAGDRRIRLQHNREIVAGEWVEILQWPYEVTVPVVSPEGGVAKHTYPAGTVFLGTQWEPWAWELVKAGKLRGYSVGGGAERVLADIEPEAVDKALAPVEKHPGHPDQKVHGRRYGSSHISDADLRSAKGRLQGRAASTEYNDGYDQAVEHLRANADVQPMIRNRSESMQRDLKDMATEPAHSVAGEVLAANVLSHAGYIDGATGEKRRIRRPLFGGEFGGYTLAVGPWGKAANPLAKHGDPSRPGYAALHPNSRAGRGASSGADRDAKAMALAEGVVASARSVEPEVTADMQDLAAKHGGEMVGLQHRLKEAPSMARKIKSDADSEHGGDMEKAASAISDSVRYTMQFPTADYAESVDAVLADLKKEGYGLRVKNYWRTGDPYNGINVALTHPKTGHKIELQFHTPQSFEAKMTAHPLYETLRTATSTSEKRAAYLSMVAITDRIGFPSAEVLAIGDLKFQPMPV